MRLAKSHKVLIAIIQVALIGVAFLLLNGAVALALYLVSEISIAEVSDFVVGCWTGEGLAVIGYHIFRRAREKVGRYLNESRDNEVVSDAKIKELKQLLRK